MEKKALRKHMRTMVRQIDTGVAERAAEHLFAELEKTRYYARAKSILMYWSLPDEPDTHSIVERWSATKHIYLPSVCGDDTEIRPYKGMQSMQAGAFGILEPSAERISADETIDLVVIPALGYDKRGYRLGRGKGYYDKLLSKLHYRTTVGVCFDVQLVDCLPNDPWDIPVMHVLTAKTNIANPTPASLEP